MSSSSKLIASRATPSRHHPLRIPLRTIVLTNLLHLLTSYPLEKMTARDILELDDALITFDIRPDVRPSLLCHVRQTSPYLCPDVVPNRSTIIDVLRCVRQFRCKELLQIALRHIITGQWSNKVRLAEWTWQEREDVGRGLCSVLSRLKEANEYRGAIGILVDLTPGEADFTCDEADNRWRIRRVRHRWKCILAVTSIR